MSQRHRGKLLSALNGSLVIEELSEDEDAEWALRDTHSGDTIEVWPSEVPEMVTLLNAFRMDVRDDCEHGAHDCGAWSKEYDHDNLDQTVHICSLCDEIVSLT